MSLELLGIKLPLHHVIISLWVYLRLLLLVMLVMLLLLLLLLLYFINRCAIWLEFFNLREIFRPLVLLIDLSVLSWYWLGKFLSILGLGLRLLFDNFLFLVWTHHVLFVHVLNMLRIHWDLLAQHLWGLYLHILLLMHQRHLLIQYLPLLLLCLKWQLHRHNLWSSHWWILWWRQAFILVFDLFVYLADTSIDVLLLI